jgi:hypothetical protein
LYNVFLIKLTVGLKTKTYITYIYKNTYYFLKIIIKNKIEISMGIKFLRAVPLKHMRYLGKAL